jgi:predicted small lipoprotein YifL
MTHAVLNRRLLALGACLLLSACGIKGGLYLAPNQLPGAKPPAGSEDAKAQAAAKEREAATIPAAALRNPATDSPADMILDGSAY